MCQNSSAKRTKAKEKREQNSSRYDQPRRGPSVGGYGVGSGKCTRADKGGKKKSKSGETVNLTARGATVKIEKRVWIERKLTNLISV